MLVVWLSRARLPQALCGSTSATESACGFHQISRDAKSQQLQRQVVQAHSLKSNAVAFVEYSYDSVGQQSSKPRSEGEQLDIAGSHHIDYYTDLGSELVAIIFAGSSISESGYDYTRCIESQHALLAQLEALLDHYFPHATPYSPHNNEVLVPVTHNYGLAEQARGGVQAAVDNQMQCLAVLQVLQALARRGVDICVWGDVPGLAEYRVSSLGQIIHKENLGENSKFLVCEHFDVELEDAIRPTNDQRARLVLQAFVDPKLQFASWDFLDGSPKNCKLINLQPIYYQSEEQSRTGSGLTDLRTEGKVQAKSDDTSSQKATAASGTKMLQPPVGIKQHQNVKPTNSLGIGRPAQSVEQWKTISSAPAYQVSNQGRVRNPKTMYVMQQLNVRGTPCVRLATTPGGSKRKQFSLAQIVAEAFVPKPTLLEDDEHILVVQHRDNDLTNNVAENLAWKIQAAKRRDRFRPVWQLDPRSGERLALFRFADVAVQRVDTVGSLRALRRCLAGKSKSCGGFGWLEATMQDVNQYLPVSNDCIIL